MAVEGVSFFYTMQIYIIYFTNCIFVYIIFKYNCISNNDLSHAVIKSIENQ